MPESRDASRVAAIVLAAGQSIRMGESKLLALLEGRPLVQRALDSVLRSTASEVVVVLGPEAARVTGTIDLGRARAVVNPNFREGISTSIRAGIRAAAPSAEAYLMVLGDQPFVSTQTLERLIRAWRQGDAHLVIPRFDGRRGNPVLVDRSLTAALDSLAGDQGFRVLFNRHEHQILDLDVEDAGVLLDVDTAEQLHTLRTKLNEGLQLQEAIRQTVAEGGAAKP